MRHLAVASAGFAGAALVVMALLGAADIVGSQFLGRPVPGTLELTSSLMVAGIALGLPLAQRAGRHVRVEIFIERLPRARPVLDAVAQLSLALMLGGIAALAWRMFLTSIATNEFSQGLIEVPMWPARLALAVGASLGCLQAVILIFRPLPEASAPPPT